MLARRGAVRNLAVGAAGGRGSAGIRGSGAPPAQALATPSRGPTTAWAVVDARADAPRVVSRALWSALSTTRRTPVSTPALATSTRSLRRRLIAATLLATPS